MSLRELRARPSGLAFLRMRGVGAAAGTGSVGAAEAAAAAVASPDSQAAAVAPAASPESSAAEVGSVASAAATLTASPAASATGASSTASEDSTASTVAPTSATDSSTTASCAPAGSCEGELPPRNSKSASSLCSSAITPPSEEKSADQKRRSQLSHLILPMRRNKLLNNSLCEPADTRPEVHPNRTNAKSPPLAFVAQPISGRGGKLRKEAFSRSSSERKNHEA